LWRGLPWGTRALLAASVLCRSFATRKAPHSLPSSGGSQDCSRLPPTSPHGTNACTTLPSNHQELPRLLLAGRLSFDRLKFQAALTVSPLCSCLCWFHFEHSSRVCFTVSLVTSPQQGHLLWCCSTSSKCCHATLPAVHKLLVRCKCSSLGPRPSCTCSVLAVLGTVWVDAHTVSAHPLPAQSADAAPLLPPSVDCHTAPRTSTYACSALARWSSPLAARLR